MIVLQVRIDLSHHLQLTATTTYYNYCRQLAGFEPITNVLLPDRLFSLATSPTEHQILTSPTTVHGWNCQSLLCHTRVPC